MYYDVKKERKENVMKAFLIDSYQKVSELNYLKKKTHNCSKSDNMQYYNTV